MGHHAAILTCYGPAAHREFCCKPQPAGSPFDIMLPTPHTKVVLQLSFKKERHHRQSGGPRTLAELHAGEEAVLDHIELPTPFAQRLMELGFLPGSTVTAARCAPGGDPRVYRIDGSEIALRRETAVQLRVRHPQP
jgi:Fe2+ transport system protein FeoA